MHEPIVFHSCQKNCKGRLLCTYPGGSLSFFSHETWTLQVICGTGMLFFLSNSQCAKSIKGEASHACAVYIGVCERGWFFLCFIAFLTNLLCRMETQLHAAMRNGRVSEERETESKINSEEKTKTNCSETASEGGGLRRKVSSGLFRATVV